ncbi:MAG: hypothetical protein Q9224_005524, partial [Gallowayella concinna]
FTGYQPYISPVPFPRSTPRLHNPVQDTLDQPTHDDRTVRILKGVFIGVGVLAACVLIAWVLRRWCKPGKAKSRNQAVPLRNMDHQQRTKPPAGPAPMASSSRGPGAGVGHARDSEPENRTSERAHVDAAPGNDPPIAQVAVESPAVARSDVGRESLENGERRVGGGSKAALWKRSTPAEARTENSMQGRVAARRAQNAIGRTVRH